MALRRLAREARPNQRLQRTSAAQTSFDPRLPVSRANVKPANVYVRMALGKEYVQAKK